MENDQQGQGQEDYDLHGGAVGGHEYDSTNVKSVDQHHSEVPTVSADRNVGEFPNINHVSTFLSEDVDLMNEGMNNLHVAKCNEQYALETDYKKNSKPSITMNIPLSESRPDKNRQIAIAERQNSFQTLASEVKEIPAISGCYDRIGFNNNGIDDNVGVCSPGTDALVTSLTGAQPNFPLRSSGESPSENGASNVMVNSRSTNSTNQTRDTNDRSSLMSSASRYTSRTRPSIEESTRVIDCPKELIDLLSSHLNGRRGNNWEGLLSLYGYSYNDLRLFQNKSHEHGYFCSILEIFQDYNIEQLKEDLYNIPKRDTLEDVKKWIKDYNCNLSLGIGPSNTFQFG